MGIPKELSCQRRQCSVCAHPPGTESDYTQRDREKFHCVCTSWREKGCFSGQLWENGEVEISSKCWNESWFSGCNFLYESSGCKFHRLLFASSKYQLLYSGTKPINTVHASSCKLLLSMSWGIFLPVAFAPTI